MIDVKYIVTFVAGAGIGAAAAGVYFKKKYEAIADEEIASVKKEYCVAKKPKPNRKDDILEEVKEYKDEYKNLIDRASYILKEEEPAEMQRPMDDGLDAYEITEEEYAESELEYDKRTLQYFVDDGVIYDPEDDEIIMDIDQTIGDGNIDLVRTADSTYSLYFRNDRFGSDYEVTKVSGSYYQEK